MTISPRIQRISPSKARHGVKQKPDLRIRIGRPTPAVKRGAWPEDEQTRYLAALATTDAVEVAARAIGRSKSAAFAERARDPAFARAWDAVLDPKIDQLEGLLLDRTIARLDPTIDPASVSDTAARHDATVGMWFLEARKPERYGKARSVSRPNDPDDRPPAQHDAAARHAQIGELIRAAEKRIAEAEAVLGKSEHRSGE